MVEVTHDWIHHEKGVQREQWKVDFMHMTQRKIEGKRTQRKVRIVAFKSEDFAFLTAFSRLAGILVRTYV